MMKNYEKKKKKIIDRYIDSVAIHMYIISIYNDDNSK